MAQFFGQGPEKGCGLIKSSLELYEKEAAVKEEGTILPTWGKEMATSDQAELSVADSGERPARFSKPGRS
jgi:hypothetical protein